MNLPKKAGFAKVDDLLTTELYPVIRTLSNKIKLAREQTEFEINSANLDSLVGLCDKKAIVVDFIINLKRLELKHHLSIDNHRLAVIRKAQLAHREKQLIEQLKVCCWTSNR